jgi:hypothetical protein
MAFTRKSGNKNGRYGKQKVTMFGTDTATKTNRIKARRRGRR